MTTSTQRSWIERLARFVTTKGGKGKAAKPRRTPFCNRPWLEALEDRLAPATHVWIGGQGAGVATTAWSNASNWIGGAPNATEVGANAAILYFPSNAQGFTSNDDIPGLTISAVNFTGDITNGTGGNYTGASLLATPSVVGPNQNNYTLGVQGGVVTALPVSGTIVETGENTQTNAALVTGSGNATVGALMNSTDTIGSNVTFPTGVQASFNVVPGAGTTANSLVVSGNITDTPGLPGHVVIDGAGETGTVTFSGANTYGGGTDIGNGALLITSDGALGAPIPGTNFTRIQDGAALQLRGNLTIATGAPIQIGTGTGNFGKLVDVSGNSSINDTIVFDDGNPPGASASEIDVNVAADSLTINGVLTGASTGGATGGGPGAGLFYAGPGTLVLPATTANIYDGNTFIAAGTVSIANPLSLGSPSAGNPRTTFLEPGTVLQLTGSFTVGAGAAAAPGAENFDVNGATIESVAGNQSIDGTLTLEGNTSSNLLADTAAGTLTFSGVISDGSGANNINVNAPNVARAASAAPVGTVIFTNDGNTYTGATNIDAGALQIQAANALGAATAGTTIGDGATLQVNIAGGATVNEPITFGPGSNGATLEQIDTGADITDTYGGSIVLTNTASTIRVDRATDTANFPGQITGAGNLVVGGTVGTASPGMVELSNTVSNTYGATTVLSGTLALNATGAGVVAVPGALTIGGPVVLGVGSATPATVILDNNNEIAATSQVTINVNGLLDLNNHNQTLPGFTMVGGTITNGVADSTSVLTLTGNVTATSGSFLSGATTMLQSATIDSLNFASNVIALALNDGTAASETRTFTVNPGPNTAVADLLLGLNAQIDDSPSAGSDPAHVGALTKAGTGTMAVNAGFGGSFYTGLTSVNAGILDAISDHALGNTLTDAVPGAGVVVANNATLEVSNATISDKPLTLNGVGAAGATLGTVASPNPGNLQGRGTAAFDGPITLAGTGPDTIGANLMPIGANVLTIGNVIGGTANLAIVSGGTVVMAGATGANTYTGSTSVEWGTLALNQTNLGASAIAIPTALTIGGFGFPATVRLNQSNEINSSVPVTINPKGTLDVQGNSQTLGSLSMTAGVLAGAGGTVTLPAGTVNATSAGGVTSTISVSNLVLNGAETFNVTRGGAATDLIVSSVITDGTSPSSVTLTGGGIMELAETSANTFTGPTSDDNGTLLLKGNLNGNPVTTIPGVLNISDAGGDTALVRQLAANQTAATSTVNVLSANGTFDLHDFDDAIAALNMTGGVVSLGFGAPAQAGTLTITGPVTANSAASVALIAGNGNHVLDFNASTILFDILSAAGMIIGVPIQNGGLTKVGAGPLSLNGGGIYSGATMVNAGTLFVNGSQLASPVAVNSSGTLAGTGTVGNVAVAALGTLAPGDSPGILTAAGSVTLNSTSTFLVQLDGTVVGSGYSQLTSSGAISLGGATLNVSASGAFPVGTQFDILHAGSLAGTFGGLANGSTITGGGETYTVTYTATDVFLTANGPVAAMPAVLKVITNPPGQFTQKGQLAIVNPQTGQATDLQNPAGAEATFSAVATVRDASGDEEIFAIISASPVGPQYIGTVWRWQINGAGTVTALSEASSGDFLSISAATNAAGQGVLFGVVAGGTVWEQIPSGSATDANWLNLRAPVAMTSVSAVGTAAGPVVYAIGSDGNVYEDANTPASSAGTPSVADWTKRTTSGGASVISAGVTAAGHAEVFLLKQDGSLFQISPDGNGGAPLLLSSAGSIRAISAGDQADEVFAVTTGANGGSFQNTLWEFTTAGSWRLLNSHQVFTQISASKDPSSGSDEVFATLTDSDLGPEFNGALEDFSGVASVGSVSAPR